MFSWSSRSLVIRAQLTPDLALLCDDALQLTPFDFTLVEGLRSPERQASLLASGASRTLNSYHLAGPDGLSRAVDFYPFYGGRVQTMAPLDRFRAIADCFKLAANQRGLKVVWGGDWKRLVDGPHIQLMS